MLIVLIVLIILLIIAGAIIYFLLKSNSFKDGWKDSKYRKDLNTKVEYELKGQTKYSIDQILEIEKTKKSGIYVIILRDPAKEYNMIHYVGQAIDIRERLMSHRRAILNEKDSAFYGKVKIFALEHNIYNYMDQLEFAILELCEPNMLTERESHWINEFNSINKGGNTQVANRREDYEIRLDGNKKLLETLATAQIKRVFFSVDIYVAEISKGSNSFRKSTNSNVVKFKKNDFAFTDDKINSIVNLGIDEDADITNNEEKINIHNIPKETLEALLEISRKQNK